MTYVIAETCTREGDCVEVCPVDCIVPGEKGNAEWPLFYIDPDVCIGQNCGCNQLCTRIFKCPGLNWDSEQKVSKIDEVICIGCGVCASICPSGAILRKEVA